MQEVADQFVKAFVSAWMARDGKALSALFAEDADFVNVTGIWWEDRAAIARAHQYALDSFFSETRLIPGRVKVRSLGRDHVLVHLRARLTGQKTPSGARADDRTTILSFVLERRAAGWIAVSAQNTDVVPGRETHLNAGGHFTAEDYRRR